MAPQMGFLSMLILWGVVGAGMVAISKLPPRCPCPWWKLGVAFLGGILGGLGFHYLADFKLPYTSIDLLVSFFPVIAVAAVAYCIVCPFPRGPNPSPPPPIDTP
jgi:hypothetical protein